MPNQLAKPRRESPRRLIAELVYDTGTQSLPLGLRTVGHRSRCVFFVAEDFEVMLEVVPESSPHGRLLTGSVMKEGLPLPGVLVRATGPAQPTPTETDRDGAFRWSGLPPGDYVLEIEHGQHVLALPTLSLESA